MIRLGKFADITTKTANEEKKKVEVYYCLRGVKGQNAKKQRKCEC